MAPDWAGEGTARKSTGRVRSAALAHRARRPQRQRPKKRQRLGAAGVLVGILIPPFLKV